MLASQSLINSLSILKVLEQSFRGNLLYLHGRKELKKHRRKTYEHKSLYEAVLTLHIFQKIKQEQMATPSALLIGPFTVLKNL